jgi:hypothetical protein
VTDTGRRLAAATVALAVVVVVAVLLWAPWQSSHEGPFRYFAAASFWNTPLAAGAALDPSSPAMVSHLLGEVNHETSLQDGPNVNTTGYSVPIYTVSAGQSASHVALDIPNVGLAKAFSAVPLPGDVRPASGTDGVAVIWQPSTDKMWEFWQLHRVAGAWHARWGGAMGHVQRGNGLYTAASWPGAQTFWGVSASSLPQVGGLMLLSDLKRMRIDHALALAIPDPREHVYTLPAARTDGQSTDPNSLPEGARLRLDPALNLKTLHLPPLTLAMARAAQRYGMIVRDTSPVITFYAQDSTPLGPDPYYGRHGFFGGLNPRQLMAAFPWSHLQVLKLSLHQSP